MLPGRDSGPQERPHEAPRRTGPETDNFSHSRAAGLGGGDWRDRAATLERAQLAAGDLGVLPGSPHMPGRRRTGCERRLRHAPVERWKKPGARGRGGPQTGTGEQRRPAAGCSHGKTHRGAGAGASGGGRRARESLAPLAGRPGRGCFRPPPPSSPTGGRGRRGKTDNAGGEDSAGDQEREPPRSGSCAPDCPPRTPRALGRQGRVATWGGCMQPLGSCGSRW